MGRSAPRYRPGGRRAGRAAVQSSRPTTPSCLAPGMPGGDAAVVRRRPTWGTRLPIGGHQEPVHRLPGVAPPADGLGGWHLNVDGGPEAVAVPLLAAVGQGDVVGGAPGHEVTARS